MAQFNPDDYRNQLVYFGSTDSQPGWTQVFGLTARHGNIKGLNARTNRDLI